MPSFLSWVQVLQPTLSHWQTQRPLPSGLTGTDTPHTLRHPLPPHGTTHPSPAGFGTCPQQGTILAAAEATENPRERRQRKGPRGDSPAAPPVPGYRTAATNSLLLQVKGVRPPLDPEDVGHRVLAHAGKQRKGELGRTTVENHALREAQALSASSRRRQSQGCAGSIAAVPPLQLPAHLYMCVSPQLEPPVPPIPPPRYPLSRGVRGQPQRDRDLGQHRGAWRGERPARC